jgi:hypothetical protein
MLLVLIFPVIFHKITRKQLLHDFDLIYAMLARTLIVARISLEATLVI